VRQYTDSTMKVYEKLFLRSRQHPVSKKEKFSAGIADP
jgi:hypothetical protein